MRSLLATLAVIALLLACDGNDANAPGHSDAEGTLDGAARDGGARDAGELAPPQDAQDSARQSDAEADSTHERSDAGADPRDADASHGDSSVEPDAAELGDSDSSARLVRTPDDALRRHVPLFEFEGGTGWGMAAVDPDGDGDLDLFVGTTPGAGHQACVYENVSDAHETRFAVRPEWCLPRELHVLTAAGWDLDENGDDELILSAQDALWTWDPSESAPPTRIADRQDGCDGGPLLLWDADADGIVDLSAACRPPTNRGVVAADTPDTRTFAWSRTEHRFEESPTTTILPPVGTLGLGQWDANNDGLIDAAIIVDTGAQPGFADPRLDPGGVVLHPSPFEGWTAALPWGPGIEPWGSFMGLTIYQSDGEERALISDIGSPTISALREGEFDSLDDVVDDGFFGEEDLDPRIAWGSVVNDFDDDGLDDVFLAFGHHTVESIDRWRVEPDRVFLQDATGRLHVDTEQFHAADPRDYPDAVWNQPRASRAALQADFDHDGRFEIVVLAINGPPFLYEWEGRRRDCTVRPTSRVVHTSGPGYATRSSSADPWRTPSTHGESLSSDPAHILTRGTSGQLRFPSGAVVPFRCDEASYAIDLEEPDWIAVESLDPLRVRIDESVWPEPITSVRFALDGDAPRLVDAERREAWESEEAASRVMVQINGRWVGRWLPLASAD